MRTEESTELELLKLKDGIHVITYQLDDAFFEQFENSSLHKGDLKVTATLEKLDNTVKTNLSLEGKVAVTCDNCLENIYIKVNNHLKLLVKISETPMESEDDAVAYVNGNDGGKLNLKQHIYDMVYTALPIRRICKDSIDRDTCNEEFLNKLNSLNNETPPGDETDPRWDKLKNLLK